MASPREIEFIQPKLPEELTDLIIDHLAEDLRDVLKPHQIYRPDVLAPLLRCALVSKAFHNRTSYHLFSIISLSERHLSPSLSRSRTVSGLLQLLEGDPRLVGRVQVLKLHASPIHYPLSSIWNLERPKVPAMLESIHVSAVLEILAPRIRSFHLLHHHHEPCRFSDLPDSMKTALEGVFRGRRLSHIEFVGFYGIPLSFLARCGGLMAFEYHHFAYPYLEGRLLDSMPNGEQDSLSRYPPLPFSLRHVGITGSNGLVEALVHGQTFSRLRSLRHDLKFVIDLAATRKIIQQAASSLESLQISGLHAPTYLEQMCHSTIDIGQLVSLRRIAIHSYGSFARHGTRLLRPLSELLSSRAVSISPTSAPCSIETVKLDINWGSVPLDSIKVMFDSSNPDWQELDHLLGTAPHFRNLKEVRIRFGAIVDSGLAAGQNMGRAGGQFNGTKVWKETAARMEVLFERVRGQEAVDFRLKVDPPIIM